MALVDNREQLSQQASEMPASNDKEYRPPGRHKIPLGKDNPLTNLLGRQSSRMETSQSSLNDNRVAPEAPLERSTARSEVKKMMEFTMTQLVD